MFSGVLHVRFVVKHRSAELHPVVYSNPHNDNSNTVDNPIVSLFATNKESRGKPQIIEIEKYKLCQWCYTDRSKLPQTYAVTVIHKHQWRYEYSYPYRHVNDIYRFLIYHEYVSLLLLIS